MGLDFQGSDVRWSYISFHFFRKKLACEIGMDLEQMEGFDGKIAWDDISDPIKPFLNHSDCDGKLTPAECKTVAPRLRELVKNWPDDDWDKKRAIQLADDMQMLAKKRRSLIFH